MTFKTWFKTFLEEKKLPFKAWDFEIEGNAHHIDSDVVIEAIQRAPRGEQTQIKDTLVKIDFINGDVMHFFEHLARALCEQYEA